MAKRRHGRVEVQTHMNKNGVMKWILIPCVICVICSCVYLIWFINNQNSTYQNIQYIKSFQTSSGKINDFSNKLGMRDPKEDIKWFKTDKEIRIEFGRIFLTWEPEAFYTQENLDLIGTIGFTIDIKEEDGAKVLHLYYRGEELERWVR